MNCQLLSLAHGYQLPSTLANQIAELLSCDLRGVFNLLQFWQARPRHSSSQQTTRLVKLVLKLTCSFFHPVTKSLCLTTLYSHQFSECQSPSIFFQLKSRLLWKLLSLGHVVNLTFSVSELNSFVKQGSNFKRHKDG